MANLAGNKLVFIFEGNGPLKTLVFSSHNTVGDLFDLIQTTEIKLKYLESTSLSF